jgi:surface antigen
VSYHHRHYGHKYPGYGFYYSDSDALKWLGFTAITLSLLDNLSEHAQRQHEAAQIKATSMPVGEPIVWHSGNASGEVVTTREGRNQAGQKCREYQQTLFIDGKSEQVVGTACLAEDGRWQVVANSN